VVLSPWKSAKRRQSSSSTTYPNLSKLREELRISSKLSHAEDHNSLLTTLLQLIGKDLYSKPKIPLLKEWITKMTEAKLKEQEIVEALETYISNQPLHEGPKRVLDQLLSTPSGQELLKISSKEIGIYQYAFGSKGGLASALRGSYLSQYGRSEIHKEHHLAIPWSNGTPCEGTQFQNSYQTLFKTCLYYLHEWNDPQDTLLCIKEGLKVLEKTLDKMRHPELADAFVYYQIAPPITMEMVEAVTKQINAGLQNKDRESVEAKHAQNVISFFLNRCVFPRELKSYKLQVTSTSQTLLHMGNKKLALSGTIDLY
jgi:hypothetical protein